jgi:hypothetical protein
MSRSRIVYAAVACALGALGVIACSGADATVGGGAGEDATADAQTIDSTPDVTSGSDRTAPVDASADRTTDLDASSDRAADSPSDAPSEAFVGIDGGADGPTVQIFHPAGGVDRTVNVSIYFHGVATDPTDGILSGSSLVWIDSLEGQFGTGDPVNWAPTKLGSHTITLRATDSKNYTATATITFNVIP